MPPAQRTTAGQEPDITVSDLPESVFQRMLETVCSPRPGTFSIVAVPSDTAPRPRESRHVARSVPPAHSLCTGSIPWAVKTVWRLQFARDIEELDLRLLAERLRLQDPSLDFSVRAIAASTVHLEFSWHAYDAEELSRSAVAIGLIEDIVADITSIEGIPRSEWPVGAP
jgi:hypothetical protein